MSGKKVTKELHASIRTMLKTTGVVETARKHGISRHTVRRIRQGGDTFAGYKRVLSADHASFDKLFPKKPIGGFETGILPPPKVSRFKRNIFDRAIAWAKGKRG